MSYTCVCGRELVQGKVKNMVPSIVRMVHYNNYEVFMRGNKLIKQLMKTSSGTELVKELPVCDEHMAEWKERNPVLVDSTPKYVTVEYSKYPIREEDKQQAIENDRVVVIDTLPAPTEEKKPMWGNEDYIGFDDEPGDKYD